MTEIISLGSYAFDFSDYYVWSSAVNAATALTFGLYVFLRDVRDRRNLGFFLFAFPIFVWAASYLMWQASAVPEAALFWTRSLMAGAIFITWGLLYFFLQVLGRYDGVRRLVVWILLAAFLGFLAADFTPLFVGGVHPAGGFDFWPQPGPLFPYFTAVWGGTAVYALTLLVRGLVGATGERRRLLVVLMVGFAVAIVSGSVNFLLWYGIPVRPFTNILSGFYVTITAYGIVRHGLFRVNVRVANRVILETLPDAVFAVDRGLVAEANPAASRLLSLPSEEIVGRPVSDFLEGSREAVAVAAGAGGRASSLGGYRLKGAGGLSVPVRVSVGLVPNSRDRAVFLCHDVSDLTSAVREANRQRTIAEEEKERIRTVMESIDDGIFVVDMEGTVTMANRAAAALAGRSLEECVGRPYGSVFSFVGEGDAEDSAGDFVKVAYSRQSPAQAGPAAEMARPDGKRVPIGARSAPIGRGEGLIGAVVVMRDETESRRASRHKTEVVSVAAHQLKTPLSAIRWNLETLLDPASPRTAAESDAILKDVSEITARMNVLVNDLLNVSRLESGRLAVRPEETDLTGLCEGAIREVSPAALAKGVEVNFRPEWSGTVRIDPGLMHQASANLLTNAVKYTPAGGRVDVFLARTGEWISVRVADTGIGIPFAQQDRVFGKLFRADNAVGSGAEGTGLGLHLAKSIAEISGGRLEFTSKEGKGSVFRIDLPLAGSSAREGDIGLSL